MRKFISKSVLETRKVAENVLRNLTLGKQATVLALYGDLGSGKTTFVQELAKFLGIHETVQSPTFVIIRSYKLQGTGYKNFFHIDAYRLEKPEELANLDWNEMLNDPRNLVTIEWADHIEELLPPGAHRIHFKFLDEGTREIEVLQ